MSLIEAHSAPPQTSTASDKPKSVQPRRVGAKVKRAANVMIQEGLPWQQAADKAGLSRQHFWLALQQAHVIAYIRQQRQVFRASLVDEATFRVRELSRQDENKAAAFSAASKLMNEQDEQVNSAQTKLAPGLVVIIESSHALPSTSHAVTIDAQAIDSTEQAND